MKKTIVVNTRFLLKNKLEGIGWFSYETLIRITKSHPEINFVFLFDRAYDPQFVFSENITPIVLSPPARHPFLWYWWFEVSVKNYLNRIKPDLFVSPDGFLSIGAQCPQLIVVHDIAFEHYPQYVGYWARKFYKYFTPKYAEKANRIVTVSEFSKQDIVKQYSIDPSKIDVVYNGASNLYHPLTAEEKQHIKLIYAEGHDYFLFTGAIHPRKNLQNILLSFDLFRNSYPHDKTKKLIIAGRKAWQFKEILNTYEAMQYKKDVLFVGHVSPEILSKLMGSATALLYVSLFEGFGIPIVEAMQSGTPVITSNITATDETAGEAAIKVNPFDVQSITESMIQLSSDEVLQNQLIQKGLDQSKKFSWDMTATKLWESITKIINP